jgi:hypothetical protein
VNTKTITSLLGIEHKTSSRMLVILRIAVSSSQSEVEYQFVLF